jgi:hypothetical protein
MNQSPEAEGFSGPSRMHVQKFPSYMLKLMRAMEHLGELYAATQIFSESSAYALRIKPDPDTGEQVLEIKLASQPPVNIGTLASDCVHNLRQSLDHLAYRLAIKISGSDPPPNEQTAGFPIHNSNNGFRSNLAAKIGDSEKIPRPILKALTDLQPYNSWEGKQLAVLRDLDDRAKHRELPVCVGVVFPGDVGVEGEDVVLKSIRTGPLEVGEAEIARFEVTKPEVEMEIRGRLKIDVVFGNDSPAGGESVVKYLQATRALLIEKVMKVLMPEHFQVFEPLTD